MRLFLWIAFVVMVIESNLILGNRVKRHLSFKKGTTFFYRLNYKISAVPWTTIFAQASGFKVAWHLPDDTRARRNIEDLHETIEIIYESYGFNGRACVRQNICEALYYAERNNGIVGKILKLLISTSNSNWTHVEDHLLNCEQYKAACPMQLISTDGFSET